MLESDELSGLGKLWEPMTKPFWDQGVVVCMGCHLGLLIYNFL